MSHAHYNTHVHVHACECGRQHAHAHTHVHEYDSAATEQKQPQVQKNEPVAKRTRAQKARITWENTPWHVDDRDLKDLLAFLLLSDDPWERSLIPAVEKDAIDRAAKRAKNQV